MFIISDALQLECLAFEGSRIPFLQSEYPCSLALLGRDQGRKIVEEGFTEKGKLYCNNVTRDPLYDGNFAEPATQRCRIRAYCCKR
jgi:hypothetical protein